MKNVVKKGIFFLCICLFTSNFVNAVEPAVTITASSSTIDDWSKTYNAGTANEIKLEAGGGAAMASKKPCGVSTNQSVLSLSSSDTHYLSFELPSGSNATIDSILFRLSGNSSGTSDWFSPLFSCDETTFNTNKITGVVDVHFTGYDQACTDKMAKLTNGTKSCRMYRRVKYTPGTPGSIGSGSNYGSGQTMNITYIEVYLSGGAPVTPTVNSVTVSPASATLDPNGTQQLTANVDATPASADKTVTWTSSDPSVATVSESGLVTAVAQGTATITATSNLDNTKSGTCSVIVNAPAAPIPVTAIALNKSTTTIAIGDSETLTINYTPADANTGKAVTWTSSNTSVATVDNSGKVTGVAAGSATITATSTTDNNITASCAVTVQAVAVTGVSINPTSANLQIGGGADLTYTVLPANATDKSVSWSSSNTSVANVNNGHVTAVAAGTATITVTTTDGNKTATCSVTVTAGPPVPYTTLTTHVPEIYEAKEIAGGYNGTLSVVNGREYEVYYATYDNNSSHLQVAVTPGQKLNGITYTTTDNYSCKANDGWFEMHTTTSKSDFKDRASSDLDEFKSGEWAVHKLLNNGYYKLHIKGFDQFSFYGKDNSTTIDPNTESKNKRFQVYIDDVLQPETQMSTTGTIRRYDITTGEHVIEVRGIGSSNNEFYGFSLRVAQEPRTKWLKGNDSTQKVNAHGMIAPITYVTKYNNIAGAETKLEWLGTAVDGISLQKTEGSLTDTLMLTGTANAPAGEYKYAVVAYYNGVETSRATGSFFVKYQIKATTETDVDAEQGDEMDEVKCRYYVYDETTDIIFKWINDVAAPGVTTKANNGTFTISGTPTTIGTYSYLVTVTGGDTVSGIINVKSADLGVNPILYLYKNTFAYNSDYIYTYLKQSGYNLKEKKAKANLRPTSQYAKYKWILISEDVDADNPEVFQLMRGSHIPVLNMKAFSYSHTIDSLQDKDGYANPWGEANNGSLNENGKSITVLREDHPIFQAMHKKQGDKIQVLDSIDRRGLMPIKVTKQGSLCLATALTRDREDYFGDGDPETFLHEYPTGLSGNDAKYICFPIAMNSSMYLTAEGKDLLNKVIQYLTNEEASVARPDLYITKFKVGEAKVTINEGITNTITVEIDTIEHPEMAGITKVIPETEVADPHTHIVPPFPALGDTLDLSIAQYLPVDYVVTDYIHRKVYEVTAVYRKPLGIEEVEAYSVGQWVNVYDIYGRKVATTNEDIYTMSLPRGIYIIVTENGQTLKISR